MAWLSLVFPPPFVISLAYETQLISLAMLEQAPQILYLVRVYVPQPWVISHVIFHNEENKKEGFTRPRLGAWWKEEVLYESVLLMLYDELWGMTLV